MSTALLLLPDFLLIVLGFALCRYTAMNRTVWDAVERLVYYLLFPVLLFNSILKSPLQPMQTLSLAAASVGTVACGIVLGVSVQLGWRGGAPPALGVLWGGVVPVTGAALGVSAVGAASMLGFTRRGRRRRSASIRSSRSRSPSVSAGRPGWPGWP